MIVLALLLAQAAADRGADVYQKTCAVPYCHGPQGGPGRAPQLAGRGVSPNQIERVTRNGIPNGAMPGFQKTLSPTEITAVIEYVIRLSGPPAAAKAVDNAPPPGREVFFDPARLDACGACHAVEGFGVAAGPDLTKASLAGIAALRTGSGSRVLLARPAGEAPFAAIVVEQGRQVRLYDVSVAPPVLRTFPPGAQVAVGGSASWDHAAFTRRYTDADLEAVLAYLNGLRSANR